MQCGDRGDGIERPIELVRHGITLHPGDFVTVLSCFFEHRPIQVDARHLGHCLSQFYREQPVPTPHIESRPSTSGHRLENQAVIVDVVVPTLG